MKTIWNRIEAQSSNLPYIYVEYITECIKKHLSFNTIAAYEYEIITFFNYILNTYKFKSYEEITLDFLNTLKPKQIESYIFQKNKGNARAMTALRHFFNYFYKKGLIDSNPALLAPTPNKLVRKSDITINLSEIFYRIKSGEGLSDFQKTYWERSVYRDAAIMNLIVKYSFSPAQITELEFDNFDSTTMTLCYKERTIQLDKETSDYLLQYILSEREPLVSYEAALFIGSRSKRERLSVRTIEKIVKKYSGTSAKQLQNEYKNQFLEIK